MGNSFLLDSFWRWLKDLRISRLYGWQVTIFSNYQYYDKTACHCIHLIPVDILYDKDVTSWKLLNNSLINRWTLARLLTINAGRYFSNIRTPEVSCHEGSISLNPKPLHR